MLVEQKVILENLSQDLDNERAQHSEALAKLQKTQIELQMVKASMQSLDEKMLKLLEKSAIQEKESKDVAIQYTLMARISMMLEPIESRASWNVKEELDAFRMKFLDSDLEEWGVPEIVGSPSAAK